MAPRDSPCDKQLDMSTKSKPRGHHPEPHHARSGRRRLIALVLVAALGLGWLAWNLLLVESDVASVAEEAQQAPDASAP